MSAAVGVDLCPSDPEGTEPTLHTMRMDLAGLWTNPSPLGQQVPVGGLKKANDVVIDRPGVGQPRRADDDYVLNDEDPGAVRAAFDYAAQPFAWNGTTLYTLDLTTSGADPAASFITVGALAWDGSLRYATGGGDLYFTTDAGPMLLDGTTGTPRVPGAPLTPDIPNPNPVPDAALGWLPDGYTAAYKVVFGYNDAEGRPVLGEPSGRVVVRAAATGGPFYYQVYVDKPSAEVTATSGHFFQIYRTPSAPAGVDPGDSYYQVWEQPWTTALSQVTVEDIAAAGEVPLYTNPDRGGVRSSNVRPPLAQDMTPFRDRMWLANTVAKHTMTLRFIAPPNPMLGYSIQIGDDGYVLDTPNTTGADPVSLRIEDAARYLVLLINASDDLTATYSSGAYDAPGIITITSREFGVPFSASAIIGGAAVGGLFVPNITTAYASNAATYPNRLHYSKPGIYYGFPLSNTLQVGAEEHAISRIVALRDTLLVFKAAGGDGLWKVTGNGPFYVEQVNAGVQLLAPDTVVVADNTAFALTDKGIIAVSESGSVDVISVPVEDKIRDIILTRPATVSYARAFVREANTEEKVYFGFPNDNEEQLVVESYVWNIATETWTRDTRDWRSAYVNSAGAMVRFYEEEDSERPVYVERNSGDLLADTLGVYYEVEWNTETADMPGGQKQFTHASVLYEQAQPLSVDAEIWFTADDGTQGPAVETGGEGFPYIRAEVPFDQQRTSRLGVEIRATVTTTPANIVGVDVVHRTYGTVRGR